MKRRNVVRVGIAYVLMGWLLLLSSASMQFLRLVFTNLDP